MVRAEDGLPVRVFVGCFGSGKSEIAMNYAVALARTGLSAILVDLDLVTPYFRSRETAARLAGLQVEVIAPPPFTQTLDIPAVVPEILGALEQSKRPVVLDVGGDSQGARALGQYANALWHRGYHMAFVVNPYRPRTSTPAAIVEEIWAVERASRLRVQSLVSNPNLMGETVRGTIREGHRLVEQASETSGIPVEFLAVADSRSSGTGFEDLNLPVLPLYRFFQLPWEGRE